MPSGEEITVDSVTDRTVQGAIRKGKRALLSRVINQENDLTKNHFVYELPDGMEYPHELIDYRKFDKGNDNVE